MPAETSSSNLWVSLSITSLWGLESRLGFLTSWIMSQVRMASPTTRMSFLGGVGKSTAEGRWRAGEGGGAWGPQTEAQIGKVLLKAR